jgi:hypothetical protein
VEISEGYVVKGDVDFSTGNVKYAKSVIVGGDIKSGFTIDCGGDLQVSGTIEDATLNVGGVVLGKLGFIGQGKGIIESKGDVHLGFMKNQTIRCRNSVTIAREAINSTIFARKSITVLGNPLSVAGGTLCTRNLISVYTVGNNSGIKTMLEVGVDFTLLEELEKTEKQLETIGQDCKKIIASYKKYDHLLKIKKSLPPKELQIFHKLRTTLVKYSEQIKALERRKNALSSRVNDKSNAQLKITHAAMPGTMIKIGERHHLVREEIIGPKTVAMVKGEIKIF